MKVGHHNNPVGVDETGLSESFENLRLEIYLGNG